MHTVTYSKPVVWDREVRLSAGFLVRELREEGEGSAYFAHPAPRNG